ncbi:hypothetical protein EV175_004251 [Coemansia sp. RSA 1933]|nr:hypothetical protein EV175_004251 [Coemansia sp. RSA 1933]
MSEGNKTTDPNSRFISANAIEEARKEREDAWKRAYDSSEEAPPPEPDYDPRTLYERLQEQKRRKTESYEESRRFANQIRKLDTDEVDFLDTVEDEEGKQYLEARRAEAEQLAKFKDDLVAARDIGSKQRVASGNARIQPKPTTTIRKQPFSLQGIVELKRPKITAAAVEESSDTKEQHSKSVGDHDVTSALQEKPEQDPLGLLASYGSSSSGSETDDS